MTREKGRTSSVFTHQAIQCLMCVLAVLGWIITLAAMEHTSAQSRGLINPAEQEFSQSHTETENISGNFSQKNSVFKDRTLSAPDSGISGFSTEQYPVQRTDTIRQVAGEEVPDNPFSFNPPSSIPSPSSNGLPSFPSASYPTVSSALPSPFDSGNINNENASVVAQNDSLSAQNIAAPFHSSTMIPAPEQSYSNQGYAAGFSPFMQGMQTLQRTPDAYLNSDGSMIVVPTQPQQLDPQQLAQQQYLLYQSQGIAAANPYGYADPYSAYAASFTDPYGMYQMNYQSAYAPQPNASSLHQALLLQSQLQSGGGQPNGVTTSANNSSQQNPEEAQKQANAQWTYNNLLPVKVSSPLGETLFVCMRTMSPFNSPTGADRGVGNPLVGKSWLDHPWYIGGFVGQADGSELISNMIKQKKGRIGGLMVGYNFNDYWGLESRLNFSAIDIYDTPYAQEVFNEVMQNDTVLLQTTRTNDSTFLDLAVHYYPLGNAKWRPYLKYGLGFGSQKFVNTFGAELSENVMTMPLGMGLRYWWNDRIAIQVDLVDNIVFASGATKTQNNTAFTMGFTYAFGSNSKLHPFYYWPATPSMGTKW